MAKAICLRSVVSVLFFDIDCAKQSLHPKNANSNIFICLVHMAISIGINDGISQGPGNYIITVTKYRPGKYKQLNLAVGVPMILAGIINYIGLDYNLDLWTN